MKWKNRLGTQLEVLSLKGFYDVWDDQRIKVGDAWRDEIEKALNEADIAILMISADFLTSKFIQSEEIPKILGRRKKEGLWVIPIFLKPCPLEKVDWLSVIQGEPRNGKTLEEIDKEGQADKILSDLVKKIAEQISVIPKKNNIVVNNTTSPNTNEYAPIPETKECQKNRENYNSTLRTFFKKKKLDEKFPFLDIKEKKMTDYCISPPMGEPFLDCICSVISKDGRRVVLIPSAESSPDIEGIGRTSVLLNLLGLTIPYARLIGLEMKDLKANDKIPIYFNSSNLWCNLIAADYACLTVSGGVLSVIPTIGEVISFVWDLARHVFRSTTIQYKKGDHRSKYGRQKLLKLFYKIPILENVTEIYGEMEPDAPYPVDEIIILKRAIQVRPSPPKLQMISDKEKICKLRQSLLVSHLHGSAFWQRDEKALKKCVDSIIESLDEQTLPKISEIFYAQPTSNIPQYVFSEIANLIGGKAPLTKPNESINPGTGIRFHNDILRQCLDNISEIRLLVTSGEKFFKDVVFWRSLKNRRKKLLIEILMLDPDSTAVKKRQKGAYQKYEDEFLKTEIKENIQFLKRMVKFFRQKKSPITIKSAKYQNLPSFRMTFIGTQRLLVTSYEERKRTGENTLFYDIHDTDGEGLLLEAFKKEYRRIAESADVIDLVSSTI